jgi:restriction endonuclease S subunit
MKMNKIDLNNLDKATWSAFRFDQIASSNSKRIDPNDTDLKHYIGLEHIDSENIHITRMGSPDDVNGQKLRCYPGDVIFGRRRAYQRKAAVCEVEGFCSAHSLVLRANPEIIDPKLFPFFLHSDAFMHRAMDISVGSLSPTINWGTLKKQEFLLPPKDQQAQLAELLWAMDEVVEENDNTVRASDRLFHSWLNSRINSKQGWDTTRLDRVALVQTGIAKNSKLSEVEGVVERPYLRVANVQDGFLDLSEMKTIHVKVNDLERFSLENEDLLLTEGGDFDKLGRGYVWQNEVPNCLHQNHIFVVRAKKEVLNPWFLSLMTRSKYGKLYFLRIAKKTSNLASINSSQLKELRVFLPSIEVQETIVAEMNSLVTSLQKLDENKRTTTKLQKSLINQVF